MLTVTHLGAGARLPGRPSVADIGPVQSKIDIPLSDGPRLMVGPMGFPLGRAPQGRVLAPGHSWAAGTLDPTKLKAWTLTFTREAFENRKKTFHNVSIAQDPILRWIYGALDDASALLRSDNYKQSCNYRHLDELALPAWQRTAQSMTGVLPGFSAHHISAPGRPKEKRGKWQTDTNVSRIYGSSSINLNQRPYCLREIYDWPQTGQEYPQELLRGIWPISAFENPLFNAQQPESVFNTAKWGVYVTFLPKEIQVSIRPFNEYRRLVIPKSLWDHIGDFFGWLWAGIKKIVAAVVDTVKGLWDWLSSAFSQIVCALAKPAMQAAMAYVTGGSNLRGLGAEEAPPASNGAAPPASNGAAPPASNGMAQLAQAGVTKPQLDRLKSNPSYAAADAIGGVIQSFFCKPKLPPLPPGSITAQDPAFGNQWRVAIPRGTTVPMTGLSGAFGEAVDPGKRPYLEVATTTTQSSGAIAIPLPEYLRALKPVWYKRPIVLALGAAAIIAVGAGTYYLATGPSGESKKLSP